MNRAEFNSIFEDEFVERLKPFGFAISGKNAFLREGANMTALIRMRGKYSLAPCIYWVLCFRHTFLRDHNDLKVPTGVGQVFDYPFKFCPAALMRKPMAEWSYDRQTANFRMEEFHYEKQSRSQIVRSLAGLADFLASKFVPWTRSMTPERAQKEICQNGEEAWIEKVWLEDYENFLSGKIHT